MEEIFSNHGFHHIAQKICNNLDAESMTYFSQTNKNILKECNQVWLKRAHNYKSILYSKWDNFEDKYASAYENARRMEICLETLCDNGEFFKIPSLFELNSEFEELLEKYLITLGNFAAYGSLCVKFKTELQADGLAYIEKLEHRLSKVVLLIEKYAKSVPAKIPSRARTHLLKMLHFAIRMKNIELAKTLLKPLKHYDTCSRTMILALNIENNNDMEILQRFHLKKLFEKEDAVVVEMIAKQCKNPSQPIHLVTRYNKDNQDFESALQ